MRCCSILFSARSDSVAICRDREAHGPFLCTWDQRMKVIILAGGLGTRLSEETQTRPKPMVEIGGKPIVWHIMKSYSHYGIHDFVICCGYKGYVIKEYFANYSLHQSDVTFDFTTGRTIVHQNTAEPWRITLVDTGENTMTGGRLKRVAGYVGDEFCMTYGDGVASVDIADLIRTHRSHRRIATVTSVQPPGRFGQLRLEGERVAAFNEKPNGDGACINGGFFVLDRRVFDYIDDDATIFEQDSLVRLAHDGELTSYRHDGFWMPMDTQRDKTRLEELWASGSAPWKVWA